jgi:hypothetical protein
MSTKNFLGGKGHLVHKADNLTAICELIAKKNVGALMSLSLWASTACNMDSLE